VTSRIHPDDWIPRGIPGLEPTALEVVKSDRNFLAVAGPGAGKTEMLAQRASFLLETGICAPPYRILAISFKRDAAKNLKDRVGRRCGDEPSRRFESYTFAAWAKSILDRFRFALPEAYRPTSDYVLDFDFGRSARLEERLLGIAESVGVTQAQVRGLDLPEYYRTAIASIGIHPEIEARPGTRLALTRALWQNALFGGARSVLDFQMIGSLSELILRSNPRLLSAMRVSYRYVFLDEFQDTTANQFNLLNTAFAGSASRVTAVGDNKQRIMLWAGAKRDVFEVFEEAFYAERRTLRMNYRSAPRLIAIQNHLIEEIDPDADAAMTPPPNLPDGGECRLLSFEDDETESVYLSALIAGWIQEDGIAPEEICILVRAGAAAVTAVLRPQLAEYGVAARIQDALQDLLAEPLTSVVIDTISVCSKAHAPEQWHNLRNAVFELHGVDEDAVTTRRATRVLSEFIAAMRPMLEACNSVPDVIAWINTLLDFLGRSGFTLQYEPYVQADFLSRTIRECAEVVFEARIRCGTWAAALDDIIGVGYVPIMSIHKSKGLEFHSVILVGLEDWPFRGLSRRDGEEECTVFVAFSRAKQRVIITSVEQRQGRAQSHIEVARFFDVFARAGVEPEEL
jgi:superfamily I DNA/RNA helicase